MSSSILTEDISIEDEDKTIISLSNKGIFKIFCFYVNIQPLFVHHNNPEKP